MTRGAKEQRRSARLEYVRHAQVHPESFEVRDFLDEASGMVRQMSRVDSTRIAAKKAEDAASEAGLDEPLTKGSVVASDAFFPFADGLITAAKAGATAVIQPGGSIKDELSINYCNEHEMAMVFTGTRHFKH